MRIFLPHAIGAVLGLLFVAACTLPSQPPVVPDPGGYGGSLPVEPVTPPDGYATCVAVAEFSEGVRNVATASGAPLAEVIDRICQSKALQACYAEGRCK